MIRGQVLAYAAVLALVAAPAFAGGRNLSGGGGSAGDAPPDGSGGSQLQSMYVLVSDVNTGQPIAGASGSLWTIPSQAGASSYLVDSRVTGDSGNLYFTINARAGSAYNLVVSAPGYAALGEIMFVGKGKVSYAGSDLTAVNVNGGGKNGGPSDSPGHVSTTWGNIKSLY